jgi:hypothetical protein
MSDQDSSNDLMDGWVTPAVLAAARGLTERTLRAGRQRGTGPAYVKVGKRVFYSVQAWKDYLRVNERQPVRKAFQKKETGRRASPNNLAAMPELKKRARAGPHDAAPELTASAPKST